MPDIDSYFIFGIFILASRIFGVLAFALSIVGITMYVVVPSRNAVSWRLLLFSAAVGLPIFWFTGFFMSEWRRSNLFMVVVLHLLFVGTAPTLKGVVSRRIEALDADFGTDEIAGRPVDGHEKAQIALGWCLVVCTFVMLTCC